MFSLPHQNFAQQDSDRLIRELSRVENRLQQWIASSPDNARLFGDDPVSAMRAAGLQIDDELMCELELIARGIAHKLRK